MDPAAQPYIPPANPTVSNIQPDSLVPMGANPGSPMPPITPGQPYLSSTAPPPLVPAAPMPLAPVGGFAPAPMGQSNNMPPTDVKHEVVEQLRKANNVLVTVSSNPSVDQLAAAIGITLVLNKLDKHATAVYSGETPSALEFLQPEKTIEKNTDSLRDFIIALDKAKADKLRYKVEDKFVKIFITPYHTSLSESDLEFSQGDFNVDVVLALGVHQREELDQSITAHGRILHDAVTISVNNKQPSDLGALNWFQAEASSLSEMLVSLVEPLQGDKVVLDEQIATSFLTGVVAETERFSNAKTTPYTMNISATLMKAGANQQLVSSKLEAPEPIPAAKEFDDKKMDELSKGGTAPSSPVPTVSKDGSLEIEHKKEESNSPTKTLEDLQKENGDDEEGDSDLAKIHIDDKGTIVSADMPAAEPAQPAVSSNMVMQPPTMGGAMTALEKNVEASEPSVDAPAQDNSGLQHAKTINPLSEEQKTQTLDEIEKSVDSTHLTDTARQAVDLASSAAAPARLEPVSALNAQPIDLNTNPDFPAQLVGPDKGLPPDPTAAPADPSAPPMVPPPMMPPS